MPYVLRNSFDTYWKVNAKLQSKKQEIGNKTLNSQETVQILLGRRNFWRDFLRLNLLGDNMGDGLNPCSLKVLLYITFKRVYGRRGVGYLIIY